MKDIMSSTEWPDSFTT